MSVVSVDSLAGQYYMDDTNLDGNIVTSATQSVNIDKDMIIKEVYVSKALRIRHETLLGTPSDVAPILWQYGAISRLGKGEKIDRLLYDNYSTISLGYAGLCECVYRR